MARVRRRRSPGSLGWHPLRQPGWGGSIPAGLSVSTPRPIPNPRQHPTGMPARSSAGTHTPSRSTSMIGDAGLLPSKLGTVGSGKREGLETGGWPGMGVDGESARPGRAPPHRSYPTIARRAAGCVGQAFGPADQSGSGIGGRAEPRAMTGMPGRCPNRPGMWHARPTRVFPSCGVLPTGSSGCTGRGAGAPGSFG